MMSHFSQPQKTYRPCPGDTMLQMLKHSLSPDQTVTPRCLKDPILVSIDVGVSMGGEHLETIGIACLDTRCLDDSRMEDAMTTRLLLLRRRSLPVNKETPKYLFGKLEYSPPEAARQVLQKIFEQAGQDLGGLRNVFLVGHDIRMTLDR